MQPSDTYRNSSKDIDILLEKLNIDHHSPFKPLPVPNHNNRRAGSQSQKSDLQLHSLSAKLDDLEARLGLLNNRSCPTTTPLSSSSLALLNDDEVHTPSTEMASTSPHPIPSIIRDKAFETPRSTRSNATSDDEGDEQQLLDDDELQLLQRYLTDLRNQDEKEQDAGSSVDYSESVGTEDVLDDDYAERILGKFTFRKQFNRQPPVAQQHLRNNNHKSITISNKHRQSNGSYSLSSEEDSWLSGAAKDVHKNLTQPQRRKKKHITDPVARYHQMQRIWAKDRFLSNGGDKKTSQRKAEGYREVFAALHALASDI